MPTRNVVLTDLQAQFVEQLVSSGRYQNASEVLREGVRLIQQREQEQSMRLQVLREAVAVGEADIDAGRYATLESSEAIRSRLSVLARDAGSSH